MTQLKFIVSQQLIFILIVCFLFGVPASFLTVMYQGKIYISCKLVGSSYVVRINFIFLKLHTFFQNGTSCLSVITWCHNYIDVIISSHKKKHGQDAFCLYKLLW